MQQQATDSEAPAGATALYDVAVIGGALSGAATAFQILQRTPQLRVVIIEKSAEFDRRVGESTVEISSYFLGRVLGLTQHLNEKHFMKQGLRYWFYNDRAPTLAECSEIGSKFNVRLPAYQIDRAVLDEEVLQRAVAAGAELRRPAQVVGKVELNAGGEQRFVVRDTVSDKEETLRARWVVDASGVAALLARQNGWWRANTAHPTTAVWSRWRGVKDWDGLEVQGRYPKWTQSCYGLRSMATNHLMGDGWWSWWIPLKGGDVSIGIVFDQRLVDFPKGGSVGERLKTFLGRHPIGREFLENATWQEGDVHLRKNLPYYSTTFGGDGFALVGDAAGFIDPFYSPGIDWIAYTTYSTAELVVAERAGRTDPAVDKMHRPLAERVAKHQRDFNMAYHRWFQSIYQDKYEYFGDYDLMRLAFLLDLGLYYLGVASQPYKFGSQALNKPVFSEPPSVPIYHFIRTYNRRLAQMARVRRARGTLGRANAGRRFLFGGFTFTLNTARPLIKATLHWGWLELTEGWRSWWQRQPKASAPIPPLPSREEETSARPAAPQVASAG